MELSGKALSFDPVQKSLHAIGDEARGREESAAEASKELKDKRDEAKASKKAFDVAQHEMEDHAASTPDPEDDSAVERHAEKETKVQAQLVLTYETFVKVIEEKESLKLEVKLLKTQLKTANGEIKRLENDLKDMGMAFSEYKDASVLRIQELEQKLAQKGHVVNHRKGRGNTAAVE